jgi:hypothetical protein
MFLVSEPKYRLQVATALPRFNPWETFDSHQTFSRDESNAYFRTSGGSILKLYWGSVIGVKSVHDFRRCSDRGAWLHQKSCPGFGRSVGARGGGGGCPRLFYIDSRREGSKVHAW